MNSSIKAIFFDIGGTLRFSHSGKERKLENIQQMIAILGENYTPKMFKDMIHKGEKAYQKFSKQPMIEIPEAELWTRFLLPDHPTQFIAEHAIELNQLWRESQRTSIFPDMVDTMRTLSKRGYKLGLISNSSSSVEGYRILAETGLTDLFSSVILSAEFGRRKPHPSVFIAAARQAGVLPQECCYVGDRPTRDLVGARQAGYGEVVIIHNPVPAVDDYDPDNYNPEKDSGLIMRADHYIKTLSQLLDYYPDILTSNEVQLNKSHSDILYDVALSTMWGVDQPIPFNETFELAKTIGLARFELNHKVTPELFAQFDCDRYYVSTLHDPCPAEKFYDELKEKDLLISSLDEQRRVSGVDSTKRTIDLAVKLGARSVVIHPGSIIMDSSRDNHLRVLYNSGRVVTAEYKTLLEETIAHRALEAPQFVDQARKSLQAIIDHTRGSGIALALENRYRYYDIPLPDEMAAFLDLCAEDWFGMQFDSGHAQALSLLGLVPLNVWLERFGSRIVGCHWHDAHGLTDHQAPGLGEIDFKYIAPFIPRNAWRTLEVGRETRLEQIAAGLEVLADAGCIDRL